MTTNDLIDILNIEFSSNIISFKLSFKYFNCKIIEAALGNDIILINLVLIFRSFAAELRPQK